MIILDSDDNDAATPACGINDDDDDGDDDDERDSVAGVRFMRSRSSRWCY